MSKDKEPIQKPVNPKDIFPKTIGDEIVKGNVPKLENPPPPPPKKDK